MLSTLLNIYNQVRNDTSECLMKEMINWEFPGERTKGDMESKQQRLDEVIQEIRTVDTNIVTELLYGDKDD